MKTKHTANSLIFNLKKTAWRLWAWLTISRRCAWHGPRPGQIMHRAPLHRAFTDGICPHCAAKIMEPGQF